ncbi:acyl carrier protein [Bradyrhizobium sp. WYCCWR 13023]|uniref:Acyl carrier protein n=1 Tax=Bradyrhizobium zhengyangense TaxID=2911009 RepID=A0A9X1RJA3_9BRAD|nr:acyl carrier protein [Bradyrhizobium zhengyangense]MCG2632720.1 acyl carrier protein [Bradyrhizobium zhengyangense]
MNGLIDQLQDVFRNVFSDPSIVLNERMTADDIDGWDSLTHINLIIAIEKQFKVKFATAEISRLKEDGANVGSLLQALAVKL